MKYTQALLALVAFSSVSARALAVRGTDISLNSRANDDLSLDDLSQINSIVEGLTGENPGLVKKAVDIINSAHFPTLTSRKKHHNSTATGNAALTSGGVSKKKHNGSATIADGSTNGTESAAKESKKAAKAAAKASKAAAAAAAAASTSDIKRDLNIFAELESRKKHNGTATADGASKASKKADKAAAKKAKAAAAATGKPTVKRNIEVMAEIESRKKHNGTAITDTAATIPDPAAKASKAAAKAAKKAAKASKKAAAAAASAAANPAAIARDLEIVADMNLRRKAFELAN